MNLVAAVERRGKIKFVCSTLPCILVNQKRAMREGTKLTEALRKPLYPPSSASTSLHVNPLRNLGASGPDISMTDR